MATEASGSYPLYVLNTEYQEKWKLRAGELVNPKLLMISDPLFQSAQWTSTLCQASTSWRHQLTSPWGTHVTPSPAVIDLCSKCSTGHVESNTEWCRGVLRNCARKASDREMKTEGIWLGYFHTPSLHMHFISLENISFHTAKLWFKLLVCHETFLLKHHLNIIQMWPWTRLCCTTTLTNYIVCKSANKKKQIFTTAPCCHLLTLKVF